MHTSYVRQMLINTQNNTARPDKRVYYTRLNRFAKSSRPRRPRFQPFFFPLTRAYVFVLIVSGNTLSCRSNVVNFGNFTKRLTPKSPESNGLDFTTRFRQIVI